MRYEYRIGKNKKLGYSTIGIFRCPEAIKEYKEAEEKGEKYPHFGIEGSSGKHSEQCSTGEIHRESVSFEEVETPEGKMTISKILHRKINRKNLPVCRCGKQMIWEGYPVWYQYEYPNKRKNVGGFMFRDRSKDKHYFTKHFKTRKSREKFIARFLEKHKTN